MYRKKQHMQGSVLCSSGIHGVSESIPAGKGVTVLSLESLSELSTRIEFRKSRSNGRPAEFTPKRSWKLGIYRRFHSGEARTFGEDVEARFTSKC